MLRAILSLPRTVWLIGLISLINDSASDMVYPLIPLYLASVLATGPRALGIIEGIAEATASLLKLLSGVIMDRTRRARPWIIFGYGIAGIGRPLIAFVSSWPWLLLIRFSDRIGKGLRTSPRDALLAASIAPEQRGLAFGLHRAMDNAGAVIGPLAAAFLLSRHDSLRAVFLWAALPAVLCIAFSLALRETGPVETPPHTPFDWQFSHLSPTLRRYLLIAGLFTLGNSSNMFLLLRARELGVSEVNIPLLWAAVSFVATLFSTPLSALSDRFGRIRLLGAGYLAYAVFYAAFGLLSGGGPPLFALFAFYGLFMAATEGVEKALVADLATAERRGTAYGWFNLITGATLLPASVVFGNLYQSISPTAAFLFSAACALLAALLIPTVRLQPRAA